MLLDLSRNFRTWSNTESVTYTSTRRTSPLENRIDVALRQELSTKDKGGGVYVAGELFWLVPQILLAAGVVPKPADVITDRDGVAWTVIDANGQCRDANGFQEWRLRTLALSIAFDLRDSIDIERAEISYSGAGAEQKAWPSTDGKGKVLYKSLAARVQDMGSDTTEERGIQAFKGNYTVYLSKQVPDVTFEDRVVWKKGGLTYYLNVTKVNTPDRLDELPSIEAVLAP